MSVKNRIVIYSATGVDIIFGWNIKRNHSIFRLDTHVP